MNTINKIALGSAFAAAAGTGAVYFVSHVLIPSHIEKKLAADVSNPEDPAFSMQVSERPSVTATGLFEYIAAFPDKSHRLNLTAPGISARLTMGAGNFTIKPQDKLTYLLSSLNLQGNIPAVLHIASTGKTIFSHEQNSETSSGATKINMQLTCDNTAIDIQNPDNKKSLYDVSLRDCALTGDVTSEVKYNRDTSHVTLSSAMNFTSSVIREEGKGGTDSFGDIASYSSEMTLADISIRQDDSDPLEIGRMTFKGGFSNSNSASGQVGINSLYAGFSVDDLVTSSRAGSDTASMGATLALNGLNTEKADIRLDFRYKTPLRAQGSILFDMVPEAACRLDLTGVHPEHIEKFGMQQAAFFQGLPPGDNDDTTAFQDIIDGGPDLKANCIAVFEDKAVLGVAAAHALSAQKSYEGTGAVTLRGEKGIPFRNPLNIIFGQYAKQTSSDAAMSWDYELKDGVLKLNGTEMENARNMLFLLPRSPF